MPRVDPYGICIEILRDLRLHGPSTERQIADRTSKRQATVQKSLALLLAQERVTVADVNGDRTYRYEC